VTGVGTSGGTGVEIGLGAGVGTRLGTRVGTRASIGLPEGAVGVGLGSAVPTEVQQVEKNLLLIEFFEVSPKAMLHKLQGTIRYGGAVNYVAGAA
jgi:hypothetical protein